MGDSKPAMGVLAPTQLVSLPTVHHQESTGLRERSGVKILSGKGSAY